MRIVVRILMLCGTVWINTWLDQKTWLMPKSKVLSPPVDSVIEKGQKEKVQFNRD